MNIDVYKIACWNYDLEVLGSLWKRVQIKRQPDKILNEVSLIKEWSILKWPPWCDWKQGVQLH